MSIVTGSLPSPENVQQSYWEHGPDAEAETPVELPSESLLTPVVKLNVWQPENQCSRSETDRQPEKTDSHTVQQEKSVEVLDRSTVAFESPASFPSSPSKAKTCETNKEKLLLTQVAPTSPAVTREKLTDTDKTQGYDSNGAENQETKSDLHRYKHGSTSPVASMYSVQSSVAVGILDDSTAPTSGADTVEASPEGPPRTPIHGLNSFERAQPQAQSQNSGISNASTSGKNMRDDYPEIVAPTPERSIISLTNRERFSKILGLDEPLHELDGLPALSNRQASKWSCATNAESKSDRPLRKSLSPTPTNGRRITENDSDSEHELTNGLMESFGRSSESATHQNCAKIFPSSSPRPVHGSPILLALRELPTWGTPAPVNVRLSHRKTVINAGQRLEAKTEAVCHPSTIREEQVPEITQVSSSIRTQSTHINGDLPSVPKSSLSIMTYAPPTNIIKSELPFAFTPLIHTPTEDNFPAELEATNSFYVQRQDSRSEKGETPRPEIKSPFERISTASPPASRPWNLDTSYPWDDDEPPRLDVVMPLPEKDSHQAGEKQPKFRLRIHRASSSNASKLTKRNRSSVDTTSIVIASSVDFLKSGSFMSRHKANQSIAPDQSNSSHDIIRTSPMQTRFVESFEQQSPVSPAITLMPPSPAHDVRSFFSDDSSQARPKGSLRKRFSDFRTRNARVNSSDHVPGYDRGLLNSAFGLSRASGRSSRQSQTTAGVASYRSRTRRPRWHIFQKIRSWVFRREEDFRAWKRKRSNVIRASRKARSSIYAGV